MTKQYKVTTKVRFINSAMRFLSHRGKGPASELVVTGRSTGERRTVVVTPVVINDATYLVAPYGDVSWVLNIRANPKVTLSKGGATARYTAQEVDGEEGGKVLARYYAENAKYVADFMDIPGEHTITDFIAAAERYPVFRLG
ncbi:MAG: nitroreductase family deazaflavin-dependent oxidoreductase [Proteobacteria bacterium]|nr:nitroreductase family deazaflavin-dependent oxidoreductase [Pseudomonadota bacterium]